jgi:hypothetical protein
MYYALIQNDAIQRINITLPTVIGNTSIGANATDVQQFGLYPIVGSEPAYDPATQRLSGPTYQIAGDTVERVYTVEAIPAEELAAKLQAEIVEATQARLDDFARTRNYDGILSLCTYATDTNPKFAAEGQYGVSARSETWATLYTILAEVQAGARPVPTGFADIEPLLPVLVWPN